VKCCRLSLTFAALALGLASAANVYHLTISDPTWIGGNELKPGEYKVDVQADKAVIEQGKIKVEVPVTVQKADRKYSATSMITESVNGKPRLDEIHFGGTETRLVFHSVSAGAGGSQ
jgi:hypothetical protein